jgi:hypothetical protein
MRSLVVQRFEGPAAALAEHSRGWREACARDAADAVLVMALPSDEALVLGAFQRESEVRPALRLSLVRRGSGGGAVLVGPGTVWLQLALARSNVLFDATPDKLLNRYVRPLLRALGRVLGVPASYFGRDWISAAHRPVGLVGFAHEASTDKALFEAIVAVSTPFSVGERATFLGKSPATLDEVAGRALDRERVVEAVIAAYAGEGTTPVAAPRAAAPGTSAPVDPPWAATRSEAIGTVAAGRDGSGRLRVGGELMASSDAIARLEALVAGLPLDASPDDVGRVVDEALSAPGVTTFGVRTFVSLRDVIVDALRAETESAERETS